MGTNLRVLGTIGSFFPILFMNIFITVVGNAYDKAKEEVNEQFAKYRLSTVNSMMLRRLLLRNYFCCYGAVDQIRGLSEDNDGFDVLGAWIRLPADCISTPSFDDDEGSSQLQQISDTQAKQAGDMEKLGVAQGDELKKIAKHA